MTDQRHVGHAIRRRLGAPSSHLAMANSDDDNDSSTGDPQEDLYEQSRRS